SGVAIFLQPGPSGVGCPRGSVACETNPMVSWVASTHDPVVLTNGDSTGARVMRGDGFDGPEIDRGRFLGRATAAAAGLGLAGALGEGAEAEGVRGGVPIVDTHQHLWDLSRIRLPWLEGAKPLAKSFLMADYLKAAEGLGIVKTVYMEVDV